MTVCRFRTAREIADAIPRATAQLHAGRLIAYPTETLYGLGSKAEDDALNALARLKRGDTDKPFLLLVASRAMAEAHGLAFSPAASMLAGAFWPGPLTLVLPVEAGRLPARLVGPQGGIAVRWSSHRAVLQLIRAFGHPISSTSANLPDHPPLAAPEEIERVFRDALASGLLLLLHGGPGHGSTPSTVVDCTGPTPRVLREGAISRTTMRRRMGAEIR